MSLFCIHEILSAKMFPETNFSWVEINLVMSLSGWWFGTFFIFPNSWDDDPI